MVQIILVGFVLFKYTVSHKFIDVRHQVHVYVVVNVSNYFHHCEKYVIL